MTDVQLSGDEPTFEEFNRFVQANIVRNNFLPVMEHLCKLVPKHFTVDEFADKKTEETTCVQFHVGVIDDDGIDGRVGYDTFYYPAKKEIIYELWWGGECYCLKHTAIEIQNMLTILIKGGDNPWYGFKNYEELKAAQRSKTLLPII